MAWAQHGQGTANVNQTQLHCVNHMGKTHGMAWQGNGMGVAWAWHAMDESALSVQYCNVPELQVSSKK